MEESDREGDLNERNNNAPDSNPLTRLGHGYGFELYTPRLACRVGSLYDQALGIPGYQEIKKKKKKKKGMAPQSSHQDYHRHELRAWSLFSDSVLSHEFGGPGEHMNLNYLSLIFPRIRTFEEVVRNLHHHFSEPAPHISLEGDQKSKISKEEEYEWEGMIRKAEFLCRKMDFLCFLTSFDMISEAGDARLEKLRRDLAPIIRKVDGIQASLSDINKYESGNKLARSWINEVFLDLEKTLAYYDFDMVAYLPSEEADIMSNARLMRRIKVGLMCRTSCTSEAPNEILSLAVRAAISQVDYCIEVLFLKKIGISGSGVQEVANALRNRSTYTSVSVSRHQSTKEVRQNIKKQSLFHQHCICLHLDCIDEYVRIDLHSLEIPDDMVVVLTTPSQRVNEIMKIDLEIRVDDHLLPWELFCRNVGRSLVNSSNEFQQMAVSLVKACYRNLLVIILLARHLKDVTDIGVWEHALHEVRTPSIMFGVLKLIWDQKTIITKHCINKVCRQHEQLGTDSILSDWISKGLVDTKVEGRSILDDLMSSFLLENVGKDYVQMRKNTKWILQECFTGHNLHGPYLKRGGLGLTAAPEVEKWDAIEIDLMNNKLSKLPENPSCSILQKLWLQKNYGVLKIPPLFFKDMPCLQNLDLSYTSIKCLPPSISRLVSLQTFNLRGCELLLELPPEIGALRNLEVFDLEGTEIMYLPKEFGKLINLRSFKVCFCGHANKFRKNNQTEGIIIPTEALSTFSRLEELCIDVNPNGEWWDTNLKPVLKELGHSKKLKILELPMTSFELLQQLRWDSKKLMYRDLSQFRFTVGHHPQRIISRLWPEVEEIFKKEKKGKKCIEYINGEGIPAEISEALNHASVFFLDRHWTIKMLSEFGRTNMDKLEFFLLVECNELQTIVDADNENRVGVPVFKKLRYLGIHYMKNLERIWKVPINDNSSLSKLRSLALHTCPNLTTIFMPEFIGSIRWLEELIVEDCPKITSLVRQESSALESGRFIRSLRRLSLLDLPELVSISGSLSIGELVDLIVYNCPKLESLYSTEMFPIYHIKGEKCWWDALKWHESEWRDKARQTYEELPMGEDLMDQLAKDIYRANQ